MKNNLMLVVVVAGLITAVYRFLPADVQYKVNANVQKIAQTETLLPKAAANPEQKKYVLVIPDTKTASTPARKASVASAYIQRLQDVQLQDEGRVVVVLPDDKQGSKHQRFILRTKEDMSVLIAHNIDIAKRVSNIKQGDIVEFYGEYVWNEKGGVVHWTHRDPGGRHVSGWLKHNGVTYQ